MSRQLASLLLLVVAQPCALLAQDAQRTTAADHYAPEWYPTEPGTIVAIPVKPHARTVEDVVPQPTPFNKPVRNIIAAWNGGTLIYRAGQPYLAIHGGGHGDYAGNEVVVFGPLTEDRPHWQLLSPPTPQAQVNLNQPYNLDQTPNVSHTRDSLCYLNGSLYRALQAGCYPGVISYTTFDSFDVELGTWAPPGTHPNVPVGGGVRGSAVADTNRNIIWVLRDGSGSKLRHFDPATNTWTMHLSTYTTLIETTSAFAASRDEVFLYDNRTTPRHALFRLPYPNLNPTTAGFTGPTPPDKCGLTWDEGRKRYAALGMNDRRKVFELNPTLKVWTLRKFTGPVEPQPQDGHGIFGRFQYVPELNGYVYVGSTSGSVYFYRSH